MNQSQALASTSQQYLDIYDITNDLVILKDGSTSLIISVTAMNFGLLAEEEQDAIIYGYAGLLNSLNYSIQILIRSQTKDITSYLNLLKAKEEETINRIKKDQIRRYREFIADLVQERNVLDKKFYVIIPATALELGLVSTQSVIPGVKVADVSTFDRSLILGRSKDILEPKRDHLISQFSRIGLSSRQLQTQEIIQLFYTIYNPEASDGQKMTDSRSYTTATVQGNSAEDIFGPTRSAQPDNMHPADQVPQSPSTETPVDNSSAVAAQLLQQQQLQQQIPTVEDQSMPQVPEQAPEQMPTPIDQQTVQLDPQTQQPLPPPAEIV